MSSSYSFSTSFTRTHARYLASKVAADLRQLKLFYGRPSDTQIDDYIEELTELLVGGYLASVDYGFRRDNGWVVAVSYTVLADGTFTTDDSAGRAPVGADVAGELWYSYLRHSSKWSGLTQREQEQIEESIPVKRTSADEPEVGEGNIWSQDKVYTSSGTSLTRRTIRKK